MSRIKIFQRKSTRYLFIATLLPLISCKKFLEIGPPKTESVSQTIFASDATATAALLSIYGDFMRTSSSINASLYLSQSADELVSYAPAPASNYYTNNLNPTDNNDFWTLYYQNIYRANSLLEGLERSATISLPIKRQLKGEALFIRAFFHFYLVNLFGEVPYLTGTDFTVNNTAGRESVKAVYEKVLVDLKAAKALLGDGFPDAKNLPGSERVRPNKSAAHTMLSRAYLYLEDWENAKLEADSVISKTTTYRLLGDLDAVFKKNSLETIWQLMPSTTSNTNGFEGPNFILTQAPSLVQPVAMSDQLWRSFRDTDKRKASWIGTILTYHYPFKYRIRPLSMPSTEYSMVLRLAEVYLIRAEALAQQGSLSLSIKDLDVIKSRAGIPLIGTSDPNISKTALLSEISRERMNELFTEWGHRWLDLKRTGQADAVLAPIKGNNWQHTDQLLPIPRDQMMLSPAFNGQQNPGYPN